jgi:hypothetical protein
MVGTMMELASNLVAAGALEAPVLFLFSGAEEPLCQVGYSGNCWGAPRVRAAGLSSLDPACRPPTRNPLAQTRAQSASAFMHFSKWAPRVGTFVNLEALGPGGVPIVFQHTGAWTVRAYARAAAHPRGAISAQVMGGAPLAALGRRRWLWLQFPPAFLDCHPCAAPLLGPQRRALIACAPTRPNPRISLTPAWSWVRPTFPGYRTATPADCPDWTSHSSRMGRPTTPDRTPWSA